LLFLNRFTKVAICHLRTFSYLCEKQAETTTDMPKKEINPEYLTCPIRQVIARFGDKWSMLVLYTLAENSTGVMRFSELHAHMNDCSQKMLSKTLKSLLDSHLVDRKVYPEVPPRVEYGLTDTGKSLIPAIDTLIAWAKEHFDAVVRP
jgi:DNA-binding HxlR family transcriptional regulator